MTGRVRELSWFAPFTCIALIALGLIRPLPRFPLPVHSRTVVDEGGTPVPIAMPFRGIVLAPNSFPGAYLEDTRSPELLVYAGTPGLRKLFAQGVMSWVYPEVVRNNNLWNDKLFRDTASPYIEVESLVAFDPSVYVGCGGPPDLVRRAGLPVFNCGSSPDPRARAHVRALSKEVGCGDPPNPRRSWYSEGYLFPSLRAYSALIGQPELAEARIRAYCQEIVDLRDELQPATLAHHPRVLAQGEDKGNLIRAGMLDAVERKYNPDDAEGLLATNPDMIFLTIRSPREFIEDPRRQGLKAVREKRVYRRPTILEWWTGGLTFKPVLTRWLAEIAHPDRLQPKVREVLRDRMIAEFGYRFSQEQIDRQLHVAENSGSVGAKRFTGAYRGSAEQGILK
jgi:hypothetical protein